MKTIIMRLTESERELVLLARREAEAAKQNEYVPSRELPAVSSPHSKFTARITRCPRCKGAPLMRLVHFHDGIRAAKVCDECRGRVIYFRTDTAGGRAARTALSRQLAVPGEPNRVAKIADEKGNKSCDE